MAHLRTSLRIILTEQIAGEGVPAFTFTLQSRMNFGFPLSGISNSCRALGTDLIEHNVT